MKILAIETATAACSVALIENGSVIAADQAIVGRGHAERLMPMIADLPGGGRADAIWVDCGPGSFTGIRVGIAAARALGLGWAIPVSGFSSLALIAATWFAHGEAPTATIVIEGGHGEVFAQPFSAPPLRESDVFHALSAEAAMMLTGPLVGNAAVRLAALIGDVAAHPCDPVARNAGLLDEAALPVRPIYGRAPDARPLVA